MIFTLIYLFSVLDNNNKIKFFFNKKPFIMFLFVRPKLTYFVNVLLRFNTILKKNCLSDIVFINSLQYLKNYYFYLYNNLKLNFIISIVSFYIKKFFKSIKNLFINATWIEREIQESFGIFIIYHIDNRRLLLDYNFIGFPFLKSYPVTGFKELAFSQIILSIIYYYLVNWCANYQDFSTELD